MSDILDLTAKQTADAIRAGDLSSAEVFETYRERSAGDTLNAYTWVAGEAASNGDRPLAGVPVAVKDLFCTEGVPSQAGSKILEGYRPPYTSTVVQRLAQAGAPLLGKTNQDEFAMGSSTENSAYGPTLNPWGDRLVPGGSSGGSAAGWRIEPPVSVPIAQGAAPDATAAADPPDDPPGTRLVSHGLRTGP